MLDPGKVKGVGRQSMRSFLRLVYIQTEYGTVRVLAFEGKYLYNVCGDRLSCSGKQVWSSKISNSKVLTNHIVLVDLTTGHVYMFVFECDEGMYFLDIAYDKISHKTEKTYLCTTSLHVHGLIFGKLDLLWGRKANFSIWREVRSAARSRHFVFICACCGRDH